MNKRNYMRDPNQRFHNLQTLFSLLLAAALYTPAGAKELWGYADQNGKIVIQPQFVRAGNFTHGFAECYGYSSETGEFDWRNHIFVDKAGNKHILPTSHYSNPPSETQMYDELEVDGKHIIQDNYVSICSKRGALMFVKRRYDFSVADLDGRILKIACPPWVPQGENPITGNEWCKFGNKAFEFTGFTKSDMPGFEPIEMPPDFGVAYDYVDGFCEGLAAAMTKDRRWVYIDAAGKVAIKLPEDCSNAQAFSEGLAAVAIGGTPWQYFRRARISANNGAKFGFIDRTGRFVIPPRFPCPYDRWTNNPDEGSQFHDGLAIATDYKNADVAFGYINRNGTFVVPPNYRSVSRFSDGLVAVNAQSVGFDKDTWSPHVRGQGFNRDEQFAQFLRQFDFIGMTRGEVEDLLGKPNGVTKDGGHEFYYLATSCVGSSTCEIEYSKERVTAFRLPGYVPGRFDIQPTPLWIITNVKPQRDEGLAQFAVKNGTK